MKTILLSLLVSLSLFAADAPKAETVTIPDAAKVKIQAARIDLLSIESQMAQMQAKFADLYRQHSDAQAAFDKAVSDAQKVLNCNACTLDEKANFTKPPEAPKAK
jgi:hypothetical protein